MSKKNSLILSVVAVVIIAAVGYGAYLKNKANNAVAVDNSNIIFFYGAECPHCQAVEKYIADNQLDQKMTISKREVYHIKPNANLMVQKAEGCKIAPEDMGVPFLWASGKCYVGDNEVENFLNEAARKADSQSSSVSN